MKKHCLLIFFCFSCWSAFAQIDTSGRVIFSNPSNKLIFIEFQSPSYYKESSNKVAKFSPLANKETADFLSENFLCFRSILGDNPKLTSFLAKKGQRSTLPKYFVFDSDSNFLASDFGTLSKVTDFQILRDSAVKKAKTLNFLKVYKAKFTNNTITKQELKHFIEIKLKLQQFDNGELIEKFAEQMVESDSDDPEILLLIMRSGPISGGLAIKKEVANKELYLSTLKKEYKNYSPSFTKRSIDNTIAYATKTKNFDLIRSAARSYQYHFHRSVYKKEPFNSWVMMGYYKNIKDTTNYLNYLFKTYDKFLLITLDSAKKRDAELTEKVKQQNSATGVTTVKISSKPVEGYFSNALSYVASQIVKYKAKDPNYLTKGIEYCQHALLLAPGNYQSKVALAQLLYQSGFYYEAEKMQREAINNFGVPASSKLRYTADLQKIINRTME